jgi:hypothetical protein
MDQQDIDKINSVTEDVLVKLSDKRLSEFRSVIKQILLICSSILGIIVSFKNTPIEACTDKIFFILALLLLALCILIGVALLYGIIRIFDNQAKAVWEHRNKLLAGEKKTSTSVFVPTEKIFLIFEKIFYVCFVLSMISLTIFAILSLT